MDLIAPVETPELFSSEAEENTLACILFGNAASFKAIKLKPDDFYILKNRWVFEAMQAIANRGEEIDNLSTIEELRARGQLTDIGGSAYIAWLASLPGGSANASTYSAIVREFSRQRQALELSGQLATAAAKGDIAGFRRLARELVTLAEGQGQGEPRFKLITYADLENRPPVEFWQDGLIQKGGLNVLYGRSGTGKTTIALGIVALPIAQIATVIYVAGEGVGGFADRIAAWQNVHRKTSNHFRLIEQPPNISDPSDLDAFIAVISPLRPALVVIDTLSCSIGGDENSSADMTKFVNACNRLQRETGAAMLIIHHTGKDESRGARGAIVLRDRQ